MAVRSVDVVLDTKLQRYPSCLSFRCCSHQHSWKRRRETRHQGWTDQFARGSFGPRNFVVRNGEHSGRCAERGTYFPHSPNSLCFAPWCHSGSQNQRACSRPTAAGFFDAARNPRFPGTRARLRRSATSPQAQVPPALPGRLPANLGDLALSLSVLSGDRAGVHRGSKLGFGVDVDSNSGRKRLTATPKSGRRKFANWLHLGARSRFELAGFWPGRSPLLAANLTTVSERCRQRNDLRRSRRPENASDRICGLLSGPAAPPDADHDRDPPAYAMKTAPP